MASKRQKRILSKLIALCLLCLIGLLSLISAEESTKNLDDRIAEAKSKLLKMIQKETFQLSGFDEFATIPITYPLDICLMEIDNNLYAACLGLVDFQDRNKTVLRVLKKSSPDRNNPLYDYIEIFSYETRAAQSIDCVSMGMEGYVGVVNTIQRDYNGNISGGSPIFQLKNDKMIPIQYFFQPGQNRMQFLKHLDVLLMWITFHGDDKPSAIPHCPIFKWTEGTFMEIDLIPCMNAMEVEPFLIDNQIYVAVANYMDEHQNIETHSNIFHYDIDTHKFNLTQQFKTYGAIDIKHIEIEQNHFLAVANSFKAHEGASALTSNAVIYRYEHSKFVPMQILPFDAEVMQFLPYLSDKKEFVLLVSMEEGVTKTYQFDGFKFVETPITFSGGSFGKGVSKMRTHKISDKILIIVVANFEMYRDATNLFQPKFTITMNYDFTKAFEFFDNWYASVAEKLQTDRLIEIYHEVEALQPPPGFGVINLENVNINTIQTQTISSTSIPIDFIEFKKALQRADEIVSREDVRRPKRLNDSMLENDMNSSISDIDFEYELIGTPGTFTINKLTVSKNLNVKTINGHSISDLVYKESDLVLKNFTVDELVIVNNTENFEAIEKMLLESDKRIKRDVPVDPASQPVVFNDLIVKGLVNGINFTYLLDNVLRTDVENQIIEAPMNFGTVRARSVQTPDNKMSNIDLSTIARIDLNHTIIRPPIRFTQGIQVGKLKVFSRLNTILINNGVMDALFKRSRRPQLITGAKEFESLALLEPISLQGKIEVSSPLLSKINPIVTINEDIVIDGSVSFLGNVTIKNVLRAENIYGKSLRYNVGQLLADGLRVDEIVDIPMEFVQPIHADNILAPTRINGVPIESLIRCNVTELQTVYAPKTFTSDLTIEGGFADAYEINDIDLQLLNNTMLKRSAKNQIITGTIQFNRIIAGKVNAERLFLGKTPFDRLLTTNTEQEINGNVTVHGSIIMNGFDIDINHLKMQPNRHIFGVDLQHLLDDSYFDSPNNSIVVKTDKSFKNLTIGELIIENDFWQIGQSTEEIEKRLDDLERGITITGPITFTSEFNIKNLTVTESINDIPSSRFGQEWLLYEGKQTFLAPQYFTNVTFNDNIQLYSFINGYDLPQLVQDSVNKSEPAQLNHVEFDNIVFEKDLDFGGKLSGISIPDDLILSYSETLQNFNEPLSFASNVEIVGTLSISETLNGFVHAQLCDLLEPSDTPKNLTIKGDVIFANDPKIEYLNSESFQHLLQTTWFTNDHYVNFSYGVQFSQAVFEKPITTAGLVNGVDLQNLQDRYLSLSQPQKVTTPIRFHGDIRFRNVVNVDKLQLGGLIRVPQSDIVLNITDFDQNVLKNTTETQFIRGRWTANEFHFLGNLSSTSINDLNFAADVARWDRPDLNVITAPKQFRSLTIDRLVCQDGCTLQGVDMDEWISKAAMTGLNSTIQGTVYVKNPVISYVEVLGLVNNMTFNAETVLLTNSPQKLNGFVTIGNRSNTNQMSSLTFENLYVNYINDKNVTEFFENMVKKDGMNIDIGEIFSDLIFTDRLEVGNLTVGQLNGVNVTEITSQPHNLYSEQFRMATDELDSIVNKLARRGKFKHFDRLVIRQTFPLAFDRLQKLLGDHFQFVAHNNSNIEFYSWNVNEKTLQQNNVSITLPENMVIIDLTVLQTDLMHLLIIQMQNLNTGQFDQLFYDYTNDLQQPKLVHQSTEDNETTIEPFILDLRHCFIQYRKFNATRFIVNCMDIADSESQQLKVQQIDSENASEIFKITSGFANAIILWFNNGEIESRWYETQNHQTHTDRRQFHQITSIAAKKFAAHTFVAICWHLNPSGQPGSVKGVASIYRVKGGGAHLEHYSDIEFSDSVILQCDLTKFSDMQTILVVAVRNRDEEMLQIYQDKGVNGFQQLEDHKLMLNSLPISPTFKDQIAPEKRFNLFESENGILNFLTMHSQNGMDFIESTYN